MRAPIGLEAQPSLIWRGAVAAVLLAAAATIVAWCATSADVVPTWARAVVALLTLALGAWVVRLIAASSPGLRWTGTAWEMLPPNGAAPIRGMPTVALDLGGWMLLRFVPDGSRRVLWLPAERRGDAAAWHALRAALHSGPGVRP